MFTGIVEEVGEIIDLNKNQDGFKISIKAHTIVDGLNINDSISCSGVCLTVIEVDNNTFNVQLVNETIKRTSAKSWTPKTKINLERSLLPTTRLGGHFVQGHVDTTIKLINIERQKDSAEFTFEKINGITDFIIEKGSICLDGISLTIAKNNKNNFKIALIPHTLEVTNWKYIEIGDMVNVEIDMMAKYIKNFMDLRQ